MTDLPRKRSNHGASLLTSLWNVPVSISFPSLTLEILGRDSSCEPGYHVTQSFLSLPSLSPVSPELLVSYSFISIAYHWTGTNVIWWKTNTGGRKVFRDFLKCEYSEENILFWLACEDLKNETDPAVVEEKCRVIYEDYISILSPKEVSKSIYSCCFLWWIQTLLFPV